MTVVCGFVNGTGAGGSDPGVRGTNFGVNTVSVERILSCRA